MKKIGILLVFLGFSTLRMAAENKISGHVLNSEQQPIAYATVSLLTSDSALITGTITNENGEFSITAPASARIVQVSFVGYETYANTLNTSKKNLKITLNEEATALAEVEVSGKRPLIERQFDKIVLNVASSPFSTGFSSKELQKKAPGVNVDKDGNVTVNGKSVSIYIDGRPSDLSGDQLKAMLEGMYSAPTVSSYYRSSDSYYLGASIRKMWKEKGLIFTLDAQDLLRSMKDKNTAMNLPEGYSSVSSWKGRYQHVGVSVTWMFGQQQYVKQRKVGTIERIHACRAENNGGRRKFIFRS